MGFWDKSLLVFKYLCDYGRQGVRHIAQQTGLSKSSVHRLQHAMERRNSHPESWLWETAEGRQWLTRLVVATLYTFGVQLPIPMVGRSPSKRRCRRRSSGQRSNRGDDARL